MAYNSMDDDEEARIAAMAGQYPAPRAPSPLASAVPSPAVPRAPLNFAASLPPAYKPHADMLAAINAALKTEVYDPQRKRLEDYTKELKARRAGPSPAERFYEIGAALAQPKSSPGFAGTIANLAPVMAAQRKARREAEDAQRELALKYDLEIGNIGDEEAKGRISGQSALMKSILAAQLKSQKQPPRVIVDSQSVVRHPFYGTAIKPPSVQSIARLKANPTEQEIALFDEEFGYGAHELILGTAGGGASSSIGEDE